MRTLARSSSHCAWLREDTDGKIAGEHENEAKIYEDANFTNLDRIVYLMFRWESANIDVSKNPHGRSHVLPNGKTSNNTFEERQNGQRLGLVKEALFKKLTPLRRPIHLFTCVTGLLAR